MERLLKHKLLIGLVAALVVAGGGAAYAATQTGTSSRQALLNDVAKRLNVSPSKLRSALQGALIDRLNAAVKAGQLTQAQANAIKQRIAKGGLPIGALGLGRLGRGGFPLGGRGFLLPPPTLRGQFPPPGAVAFFGPFGAAAKYLGISRNQLMNDLSGKTLAQVAQSRGKSVSGLEQAIVSVEKTRLDRLVAKGVLTKTQEQRQLSFLTKQVDRLVEHARLSIAPAGKPLFPGGPVPRKLVVPGGPAADALPGPPAGRPGVPPAGAPGVPPPPAA
jgi:hypothetical protein